MNKATHNPVMEWLDLRELTQYAAVSERTLRAWIHDPLDPLPAYRVGLKILVRKADFDGYIERHPVRAAESVERMVDEILTGVAKD